MGGAEHFAPAGCWSVMHEARYYREKAAQARRLADSITRADVAKQLLTFARDYEEIAVDLERGLIDMVHPESMPQRRG